jgi:hypothetical protein
MIRLLLALPNNNNNNNKIFYLVKCSKMLIFWPFIQKVIDTQQYNTEQYKRKKRNGKIKSGYHKLLKRLIVWLR